MPIALGAGQTILELLDERLSPLRIGPSQPRLGLLPRQLAAVQDRADRLATAHEPEPLAGPADQAAQRPARGWIRPFSGAGGRRALGRADHLAEFGFAARAKKGRRPPVRRNASAAGPPWVEACTQPRTGGGPPAGRPATRGGERGRGAANN